MLKSCDTKVVKFGGSSLADAARIRKAADIIRAEECRRYVVPSAPGKRDDGDTKVTDLLLQVHAAATDGRDFDKIFAEIEERFTAIVSELGITCDIAAELEAVKKSIYDGAPRDFVVSRGEYLCGIILARLLDYEFIDPQGLILFDENGVFLPEETNDLLSRRLKSSPNAVIPGFYGSTRDGEIKTFSRGGSDVTGSVVARAVGADLYENWTDVSGFLLCDPHVIDDPPTIAAVNFTELRQLSHMGAAVLHEEAVFPLKADGIPVNIRNTGRPSDDGTMIIPPCCILPSPNVITGIAGRRHMAAVCISKDMTDCTFRQKAYALLESLGISFRPLPSGIDGVCVAVSESDIAGCEGRLLREIKKDLDPDSVTVETGLCLISVVGRGMAGHAGVAARIFGAVAKSGINIRLIDQSPSELNITIGVGDALFTETVRAIYGEFYK